MTQRKEIGGYLNLELGVINNMPQRKGLLLNNGQNALEYILRNIKVVNKVFIPYYTCSLILQVLEKLKISYTFYHINEIFELRETAKLDHYDYLIYTNYFGLKDKYTKLLAAQYGSQLIIDNAQALYAKHYDGINTFYSPRKYVGIPDGAIAYSNTKELLREEYLEQDYSFNRCSHLLKRYDLEASEGYEDFHSNSTKLHNQPIKRMSELTRALLQSIDFEKVKAQRWKNFKLLHEALGNSNLLDIEKVAGVKSSSESMSESFSCPMVYPYLTDNADLKKHLIANKIFVATYWPNVFEWCHQEDLEYKLANKCLPIFIDQRYGKEEMKRIIKVINNYNK